MSRHPSQLNCEHNRIMFDLPCLELICHFSVIVGRFSCLSISLTNCSAGKRCKASQRCVWKRSRTLKRMPHKSCLEQNEKNVLSCCALTVSEAVKQNFSSVCLCCLGGPGSSLAENSWQWHIWRGFFKVAALFRLRALRAFHSFPLKYPCRNDREDGWPLTSGATEVFSCLPAPSVNQHITTNPDTTRWNIIHTVASQKPQQAWPE